MRDDIGLMLTKRAALGLTMDGIIEVERGRRCTSPEVNARCNPIANALLARGVGKVLRDRFPEPAPE